MWHTWPYLSFEDLAVDMVISGVLPSLDSSAIDVRRKCKQFVARWADLNTVTVGQRNREIN
jgi:hypothetical protein